MYLVGDELSHARTAGSQWLWLTSKIGAPERSISTAEYDRVGVAYREELNGLIKASDQRSISRGIPLHEPAVMAGRDEIVGVVPEVELRYRSLHGIEHHGAAHVGERPEFDN